MSGDAPLWLCWASLLVNFAGLILLAAWAITLAGHTIEEED